jgi:hypothetical protein
MLMLEHYLINDIVSSSFNFPRISSDVKWFVGNSIIYLRL